MQKREPIQTYVRAAGFLLLITIVAGFFGEVYAPSKLIVAGDANATAANIISFNWLFRLAFASYLIEAICDVTLTMIFYVILRPVDKHLALLAALFGIISTALYASAELFYFVAGVVSTGGAQLKSFSPEQLDTLALLCLKIFGNGAAIFMVFYGLTTFLRGYLIIRSSFLPRVLGYLLVIAGLGFIAKNFLFVLAPAYASDMLLLPMFVAAASLTFWFLVKGIDVEKWEQSETR